MRIGVDAMGGDHAPAEVVKGALSARSLLEAGDRIVLFGQAQAIEPLLAEAPDWSSYIDLEHCPEVVGMDEVPVQALRSKPNNSISLATRAHREGRVDAVISAGNTGAGVAAASMYLRRLPGVHRPGIAVVMPTFHGPVTLCDVGANVSCRPQHLLQYGIMASIYARSVAGVANPRVGLLSIGQEDAKGNDLVKDTRHLMREQKDLDFVGNVEGRDLFRGVCDVVVSDGFVGNVCLKLMEGLAEGLFRALGQEVVQADPTLAARVVGVLKGIHARYDYHEYGGAPLLGVNGIWIICHGSSKARTIYNAIRVSKEFAVQGVNERITRELSPCAGMTNG